MSCEDIRRRIQESLDGLPPAPDDRAHLLVCPACREFAERLREVDALLSGEPELAWDETLTREVAARIRRERGGTAWRAAAAAVLVGLLGWLASPLAARIPGVGEAGRAVAGAAAIPDSPGDFLAGVSAGLESLGRSVLSAAGDSPLPASVPAAIAAIVMCILLNGVFLRRPLAAGRRRT